MTGGTRWGSFKMVFIEFVEVIEIGFHGYRTSYHQHTLIRWWRV